MAACQHECECLRHTFGCPERVFITHSWRDRVPGGYPGVVSDQESRATAPGQLTGLVVVVALVSAVSGMLYGYDTGIISGALLQITKDFGIGRAGSRSSRPASCSAR